MPRLAPKTLVRNAVVLVLLAVAAASTIAQPNVAFTGPAAQAAAAMTMPSAAAPAVAAK